MSLARYGGSRLRVFISSITEDQLNEVLRRQKDWFMTAEEALEPGILTELL